MKIKEVEDIGSLEPGDEIMIMHKSSFPSFNFSAHGTVVKIDTKWDISITLGDWIKIPLAQSIRPLDKNMPIAVTLVEFLRGFDDSRYEREGKQTGFNMGKTIKGWEIYKID